MINRMLGLIILKNLVTAGAIGKTRTNEGGMQWHRMHGFCGTLLSSLSGTDEKHGEHDHQLVELVVMLPLQAKLEPRSTMGLLPAPSSTIPGALN